MEMSVGMIDTFCTLSEFVSQVSQRHVTMVRTIAWILNHTVLDLSAPKRGNFELSIHNPAYKLAELPIGTVMRTVYFEDRLLLKKSN